MAVVLAWLTLLAGGVYPWVWIPAGVAVAVLTRAARPIMSTHRALDIALVVSVLAAAAQLIPVPLAAIARISPHAPSLRQSLWLPPVLTSTTSITGAPSIPLSIAPLDTVGALGILLLAVFAFWAYRALCDAGETGRLIRGVAFVGLVAALAAIAQRALGAEMIYGVWKPLDAGARPYGSFVNRNHLGTWIIMACPLTFGYLLARAPRRDAPRVFTQRLADALKQLGTIRIWLAASVCVMTLAVLLSASRSGLTGLMAAFTMQTLLIARRGDSRTWRWTAFQLALLAVVVLSFANYDALLRRMEESVARAQQGRGRIEVWRDTLRLIEDFPIVGVGAGTYATAIAAYQTAEPGYAIGQAHNHYLQLFAEGGLLVSLPLAVAAGTLVASIGRSLTRDRTEDYLIKAGAVAGMVGVAVQSVWETGLTMPANAVLFAMLAAGATHGGRAHEPHAMREGD